MRHCTIYNIFLTLNEYTELKRNFLRTIFAIFLNCFIYVVSIATWRHVGRLPTLFLLRVKEILLVHFIITNFRVAHKMLCTPWLRNPLTTSRLSCLARKAALTTIFLSDRQSTISYP
jgi:hypothetical protein